MPPRTPVGITGQHTGPHLIEPFTKLMVAPGQFYPFSVLDPFSILYPFSVHGRSFSGLRMAQMRVMRPPVTLKAATVAVTPACWATRPGWPLTVRSRSLSPGVLPAIRQSPPGCCCPRPDGEALHSAGARVMYGASMVYVLAAMLAWRSGGRAAGRSGGGAPRPILYASGFLVLASVQVVLGIVHRPALRVPLGILMFGLSVLALGQALSAHLPERSGNRL